MITLASFFLLEGFTPLRYSAVHHRTQSPVTRKHTQMEPFVISTNLRSWCSLSIFFLSLALRSNYDQHCGWNVLYHYSWIRLEPGLLCSLANNYHAPRSRHLDMVLSYFALCSCHTALLLLLLLMLQRFASTPTPTFSTAGPESEYASTVIRIHILLWILSCVHSVSLHHALVWLLVLLEIPSITAHY